MSPLIVFTLAAVALTAVALILLTRPLWRPKPPAEAVDRREANVAVFRDQLRELERERDEGLLAEADFAAARQELQRRLLEDVEAADEATPAQSGASGKSTLLALFIAVPLFAAAGYALLGNPHGLDPARIAQKTGPQEINAMVERLAARLKANPEDPQGWVMLARSYKVLGRFAEAADAYDRGRALVEVTPELLADHAEVLGRANDGKLEGKPLELLKRALELDPNEPRALFLAGSAAADRQDFAAAADYWQGLLDQLEPGSEEAKTLAAAIEKARSIAGKKGEKRP